MDDKTFDFDVTLSFAGEDRDFVRCVAQQLSDKGLRIFYDEYEQLNLWGKDLYTHLDDVYRNKSKYCVMFISKHYKQKLWTNHERESAQARAFKDNTEYILPFRLDDTEIPGIRETTGYLSVKEFDCQRLAEAISNKLNSSIVKEREIVEIPKKEDRLLEYGIIELASGEHEIRIRKYDFFSQRLTKAFPGIRGLQWFNNPEEIIDRLSILLAKPLFFQIFPGKDFDYGGTTTPIWWFRAGASMPINDFQVLSKTKCLIGSDELEIEKLAVYKNASNYKEFIYLKMKADTPIENGTNIKDLVNYQLSYKKYATQDYATYKDQIIKNEEYEDGAMVVNGKVVRFEEEPVYRFRFLTPYNIIICAQSSVYNSREADILFKELLDKILETGNDEELEEYLSRIENISNDAPDRIDFH